MLLGSIGRSHLFGGCNRAELRNPKSLRRQDFVKSISSRSLEGSSTWGRLDLEGLCYSCTPTYSLVDQFIAWRTVERFFAELFSFLFDNTSVCYLVFAFFFSTLLAFILLL